jgi:hypothetical protein
MTSNGITVIPNFVKIVQLVQNFKETHKEPLWQLHNPAFFPVLNWIEKGVKKIAACPI